ncbi:hypothetical protein REPUB_Repub06bG0053200 [Reevesia pubescens]
MDSITASQKRLAFAKVCVEVDACFDIPQAITVELGDGSSTMRAKKSSEIVTVPNLEVVDNATANKQPHVATILAQMKGKGISLDTVISRSCGVHAYSSVEILHVEALQVQSSSLTKAVSDPTSSSTSPILVGKGSFAKKAKGRKARAAKASKAVKSDSFIRFSILETVSEEPRL